MRSAGPIKKIVFLLAVAGLCFPQSLVAATGSGPQPRVTDVELREGGVLLGQVVDSQGIPQAMVPVLLLKGDQQLAQGKTDQQGYFAFRGLQGGVYQVASVEGIGAYRVWAPGTAPPSSQEAALVVAGTDLVRGNLCGSLRNCGSCCRFYLANPLVLGALTATAIAVPIIVHNSDSGGPRSPK